MPAAPRRVTIVDVARDAGVTRSVVSRVFTHHGPVSAAAREKVLASAAKLGYRPNIAAQALVSGQSKTIGALVRRITTPGYAELVSGLQERAGECGYRVLAVTGNLDTASERAGLETLLALRVDGIIIGSGRLSNKAIVEVAQQTSTVVTSRDVPGVDVARFDETVTADALIAHLSELGHATVGFLSAPTQYNRAAVAKTRAIRTAAKRRGVELVNQPASYDLPECLEATRRLVEARRDVTAIVGLSGWAAVAALTALEQQKIKVPRQMSVACFDAALFDEIPQLGLTYVHQPQQDVAHAAVDLVIDRLRTPGGAPRRSLSTGQLVIGATTGPAAPPLSGSSGRGRTSPSRRRA